MATIQDLFADMEAADAAGDKNKAKQLAQLIGEIQGGAPPSTKRTWGEAATDVGAGLVSGVGSLVQLPGQLYGLATGNFEDTGALGAGNAISKYGESLKSEGLQAREAASKAKVEASEKKDGQVSAFLTQAKEVLSDPAQLSSFLATQLPQLILPGGAAKMVAGKVFASTLEQGAAAGLSAVAAKEAAQKAAIAAGTAVAKGTGTVMQGADIGAGTYQQVYDKAVEKGMPPEKAAEVAISMARASGVNAAGISWLAQSLPGASALEAKFAGKAGAGRLATGLGEAYSEVAEEVPGKMLQNLSLQQVDPDQKLMQGTGSTGALAAVGGLGMGTAMGSPGRAADAAQAEALKAKQAEQQAAREAEAAKKASPEYAQGVVEQFQALEAQRQALLAQKIKLDKASPTYMADREANKALFEQMRLLEERNQPLVREYNRVKDTVPPVDAPRPDFELAAGNKEDLLGVQDAENERWGYGKESRAADMSTALQENEAPTFTPDQRRAELEQKLRDLPTLLDQRQAEMEKADPQASIAAADRVNEVRAALAAAQAEHAALPKIETPESYAKKLAAATKKWEGAKALGDAELTKKHAQTIVDLQKGRPQMDLMSTSEFMTPAGPSGTDLAGDMARGREQAAAQTAKVAGEVAGEVAGVQRIAQKAGQPSEARGVMNALALDALGKPKPKPVYAQEELQGEADTEGRRSDSRLQERVSKLVDPLVDLHTEAIDKQIDALIDQRDQARMAGQEDVAATIQARISALQSRQVVNPADATVVATVDRLHKELEQAKNEQGVARASRNAVGVEKAAKKATDISDQLAQAQKEPGSIAGRLVKAKNDVARYLTSIFDSAHEMHTTGGGRALRERLITLQSRLRELNLESPKTPADVAMQAANRSEIERQIASLDRQLGQHNTETPVRQLIANARQATRQYIRAAFREENIRREANNQPPLTGAQRAAFAKQAQRHAEDVITRASAERNGDSMEEVVVRPAQMRSGKVIKSAETEWRDTRPLEERPFAKFGAARAVEEEAFHEERQKIQQRPTPRRVETGVLKRQWAASEAAKVADERGENAKTIAGQQRRRAEYIGNELARAEQTPEVVELQNLLEQHPTNGVMDTIEPLVHKAVVGENPSATEMREVHDAVALERDVAQDKTGQQDIFGEGHMRSEKKRESAAVAALRARAEEVGSKRYKSPKAAAQAIRMRDKLNAQADALEEGTRDYRAQPEQATSFERTTAEKFANAPEVKKGRAAADKLAEDRPKIAKLMGEQLETLYEQDRKDQNKPTLISRVVDNARSEYMRAQRELEGAVVENKVVRGDYGGIIETDARKAEAAQQVVAAEAKVKAARVKVQRANALAEKAAANKQLTAEDRTDIAARKEAAAKVAEVAAERKRSEESIARLAKLPHTTVTKEAESAFAKLIGANLRKEAAGLEMMLQTAKKDGSTEAQIANLEKLLAESTKNYEQLDGLLPTKIARSEDYGNPTSEKDDVLVATTSVVLGEPKTKEEMETVYRRPSKTSTNAAVLLAEAKEERNKARGRGPVVVNTTGPRKIRSSGKPKPPTANQAIAEGNVEAAKKTKKERLAAAQAQLEHIETLQQNLKVKQDAATTKKDIAKYADFEERLAAAHTEAEAALEKLQPEVVDVDGKVRKKSRAQLENELDQEFASSIVDPKLQANDNDTPLSAETRSALHDGNIGATIEGIIAGASSPEVAKLAANLQPHLEGVRVGTNEHVRHNGESVAGIYEEGRNAVTVHPNALSEETVLHELTHAATATVLNTPDAQLAPHQVEAKRGLTLMWERVRNSPILFGEDYVGKHLGNVKEFASEVYSNPELRAKMDSVGKPASLLKRFATWIARMFGGGKTESEKAIDLVTAILSPAKVQEQGETTPSLFRSKPLDYGSEAGSPLAAMADKYIARPVPFLERITKNFALSFEQGVVDMRAAHAAAMKMGKDSTADSGKLTQQAIYDMRKGDQLMPLVQLSVMQGPPVSYTDSIGLHGVRSTGKNSLLEVYEAVEKLPGNAEGKMAIATNYMIAQRVANVGVEKAGWGGMKLDEAELAKVMDYVNANPELKAGLDAVREKYNAYNEGLVNYMASTGAIPKSLAAKLLQDGDYVSMYRVDKNGHASLLLGSHVINIGEVRHQRGLEALKGGDTKILPINESLLRNTTLLLGKSLDNQAAKSAAYAYQDLGAGTIKRGEGPSDPSVLHFHQEPDPKDKADEGKRWIKIDTTDTVLEGIPAEMIVKALEGTNIVIPSVLRFAAAASDMLRTGVTRMPMYAVRQLIRDPMVSTGTAGLGGNPLTAVFKAGKEFISQTRGKSEAAERLAAKGLIQSQIFSGDSHDLDKLALQLADGKNNHNAVQHLFAMMDRASMHADAATRVLVHENALKNGLSEVQADLMTMESMNFHKRGASSTIQYAHRLIPFFSSQIQGLSVLAKAMRGNMPFNEQLQIKRKFFNNAVLLFASGLAYAAAMEDDDYYKNAKPRDKMSNWFVHLPGVDEPIKIPIPFEYGFFFSAAVAAVEGMKEDTDNAQQFAAIRDMLLNAVPGYSNKGVPQFVKPIAELATNRDFYSWNPIETAAQEGLDPERRFNRNTSEMAKRLAQVLPVLSPIQIERLVNGYFGQAPLMIAGAVNSIFAEEGTAPRAEGHVTDVPFIGQSFQRKFGGEDADATYTLANKAIMAKKTLDDIAKEGSPAKVKDYQQGHMAELRGAALGEKFRAAMGELTKAEKAIRLQGIPPDAKQKRLDGIDETRQRVAEQYKKAFQRVASAPN